MKKLSLLMSLFVALILASCSSGVPDYANIIPKTAGIVMRLDAKEILDVSNISDHDKLIKKLEKEIKSSLSGKAKEKALEILKDPSNTGVDLGDPIFIYYNNSKDQEEVGVVGGIDSEKDFTELLNTFCEEKVKKSNDLNYAFTNRHTVVIFNDDWFFITELRGSGDKAELVKDKCKDLKKRMESGKNSLAENEAFRTMCGKDGLAQLMVLGSFIDENKREINRVSGGAFESIEDLGLNLSNFAALMNLEMSDGEAKASIEVVKAKDSDKAEKQLKKFDELMGGKDEGFFLRVNFSFLKEAAKNASGYQREQMQLLAKFMKFVELKYEGDGKISLRLVTADDDMSPLEMLIDYAEKQI